MVGTLAAGYLDETKTDTLVNTGCVEENNATKALRSLIVVDRYERGD
jgi:hypothetical protein